MPGHFGAELVAYSPLPRVEGLQLSDAFEEAQEYEINYLSVGGYEQQHYMTLTYSQLLQYVAFNEDRGAHSFTVYDSNGNEVAL